ncbi:hypothetical protein BV25DRAFT_1995274 [Artomyces pyxidatus]|uniref:Uncharacterized protein n=1 Tax=Artomyces pyxidatus TaxID=48021 RepID=A0ACB8SK71_9AGAM|nr:hypothetical protein BV25DRAFT_1995274 [Artomyces pyxidatus]
MTDAARVIRPYAVLFACSTILTIIWTWLLVRDSTPIAERREKQYSYEGADFPYALPFDLGSPVDMAVEESVHYSFAGEGTTDEWYHHSPRPYGGIRLGPMNRTFHISMFHQIHCLRLFRETLTRRGGRKIGWGHAQHCIHVLREEILCNPDLTLEPGDFKTRAFTFERQGATHTCRNWNAIYDYVDKDWTEWNQYILENNVSVRPFADF